MLPPLGPLDICSMCRMYSVGKLFCDGCLERFSPVRYYFNLWLSTVALNLSPKQDSMSPQANQCTPHVVTWSGATHPSVPIYSAYGIAEPLPTCVNPQDLQRQTSAYQTRLNSPSPTVLSSRPGSRSPQVELADPMYLSSDSGCILPPPKNRKGTRRTLRLCKFWYRRNCMKRF